MVVILLVNLNWGSRVGPCPRLPPEGYSYRNGPSRTSAPVRAGIARGAGPSLQGRRRAAWQAGRVRPRE